MNLALASLASGGRTLLRMGLGLLTFRILYQHLAAADFGFYQLAWAAVAWLLLLDLGLGAAVCRAAASIHDRPGPSRCATATAFWTLAAVAGAAIAAVLAAWLGGCLPGGRPVLAFAIIHLAALPLGVLREGLRGRQRFVLVHGLDALGLLIAAGLVLAGCALGWGLGALLAVSALGAAVGPCAAGCVALRDPALRPDPRAWDGRQLRGMLGFGGAALGVGLANLAMLQADAWLVGALCGVVALATWLPAARLAQLSLGLAQQLQDALAPIASQLHAIVDPAERRRRLADLLVDSQRWALAIGLPLLAGPLLLPGPCLAVITGLDRPDSGLIQATRLLALAGMACVLGNSVAKRLLMAAGEHRRVLALSWLEAAVQIAVAAGALALTRSAPGAAYGALAAQVLIGCAVVLPMAGRHVGVPVRELWARAVAPGLAAAAPACAVIALVAWSPPQGSWSAIGLAALGAGPALALGCWRWACSDRERLHIATRLHLPASARCVPVVHRHARPQPQR